MFLDITDTGGTSISIECIYRPRPCPNDLSMCDFNLTAVPWPLAPNRIYNSPSGPFVEMIRDSDLHQLVKEPTHFRVNQNPSLLDLVLVNDPSLVHELIHLPPFGRSDLETLLSNPVTNRKCCRTIQSTHYPDSNMRLDEIDWTDGLPLDFFIYEGKRNEIISDPDCSSLDLDGKFVMKLTMTIPQGVLSKWIGISLQFNCLISSTTRGNALEQIPYKKIEYLLTQTCYLTMFWQRKTAGHILKQYDQTAKCVWGNGSITNQ
ncbi:hypothetical protein HHI36_007740 [Cryptolaemus montrouzieri]|uniref:Uncharacterized protein n=1 Tax=Cryptolaemus montrouzieri TaxID=559131 RepID=A0ABD2MQB9_9CUCU